MDPTQRVLADVELASIITDDHRLVEEAMRGHRPPQRALGGDAHRIGGDRKCGDAELLQMALPGGLVSELALLVPGPLPDYYTGQVMLAHVLHRRVVDDIVGVAGAQQRE